MTPRTLRVALCTLCACWGGLAAAAPKGTSANRLPYGVGISVHWEGEAGSEAFRADLARGLADELVERCFARVVPAEGDPAAEADSDLLLTVALAHVVDETLFDDSIADALTPGEPGKELRRQAHFSLDVIATLTTRQSRRDIRSHRLHVETVRRPMIIGEDPQAHARLDAIERIVNDLRKKLCGGSSVDKSIREALSEDARDAAPR